MKMESSSVEMFSEKKKMNSEKKNGFCEVLIPYDCLRILYKGI